ncbi:MAG TPA: hypothetical protein V6D43_20175 [Candidatus Sericytochromatia bacterium]
MAKNEAKDGTNKAKDGTNKAIGLATKLLHSANKKIHYPKVRGKNFLQAETRTVIGFLSHTLTKGIGNFLKNGISM